MSEEKTAETTTEAATTDRTVNLRLTDVNTKWNKYGGLEEGTLLMGKEGNFTKSRIKLIYRNPFNEGEPIQPVHAATPDYFLLPNEELERVMGQSWAETNGYRIHDKGQSRTGNAVFLTYVPKDDYNGSYFIEGEDYIQLGFTAHNSIDESVGFGLGSFTYRGLCWNGCIREPRKGASIYQKHTKGLADTIGNLNERVAEIMEIGLQVVAYYRQLTKVELNLDIAKALAEPAQRGQLPKRYLPFAWEFDNATKRATGDLLVKDNMPVLLQDKLVDKGTNMWSIYNNVTEAIWHNTLSDAQSKFGYFQTFHNTLENTITPKLVEVAQIARRA